MSEPLYLPEDSDVVAHPHDAHPRLAAQGSTYFSLGTGYGVGKPHYYVCLDENGGERSWWLDPDQAELLGRRLLEYGIECRVLNEQEERRRTRPDAD
jgi:hypothetical protein